MDQQIQGGVTRNILLVVPENGLLLQVAGLFDIFDQANRFLGKVSYPSRYRFRTATARRDRVIHGRSGLNMLADECLLDLNPLDTWHTVIICGGREASGYADNPAIIDWLILAAPQVMRMASVCSGAFYLAAAGLLKNKRATTHWDLAERLAKAYPDVTVLPDSIYVIDGKIVTSAGASAGFDLALAFVEQDFGSDIARKVAQFLVMYLRRPGGQSQFSLALMRQASEPGAIRDLQSWMLEHLDENLDVESIASRVAMSPRNFARVFTQQTGVTPGRYVEEMRLEAARQRLEQSQETVERIARECGLGTATSLRRVFERHLRVSPSEYRERFGRN